VRPSRTTVNAVCVLYLIALFWFMYEMTLDPDPDERRLHRLHFRYRLYQDIARRVGSLALHAEKEYLSLRESGRTV
jgi:hypothetical protein